MAITRYAGRNCVVGLALVFLCACSSASSLPDDPAPGPKASAGHKKDPRRFTLAVTGDVLVHIPVLDHARAYGAASGNAYDFRPMFDAVRAVLRSADLAICHLEVPLAHDGSAISSYPRFNAPGEVARALRFAGYDQCSVASNHSFDQGVEGVSATLDALDQAEVGHAGTARSRRESRRVSLLRTNGVAVGHLSYTYGLNGLVLPERQPWLVDVIDATRITTDARRARRAGADFVVVSLHWGAEYQSEPTPFQRALARQLLRSSAIDLIVGHHAHVVQPLARFRGEYVAYGLGNFLSGQSSACCLAQTQDGVIARFSVRERRGGFEVVRVSYVPTWVDHATYQIVPITRRVAAADASGALAASWARTVEVFGSGRPGARPARRLSGSNE